MLIVNTFSELEERFLKPLVQTQQLTVEKVPLETMQHWEVAHGVVTSAFFEIQGQHMTFSSTPRSTDPPTWDQPIYHQASGTLLLLIDEDQNILIQALFEPGNVGRGYLNSGLMLTNSCKFSPANMAQKKAQGKTIPFASFIEHPEAKTLFQCDAPGDGGRANKKNFHSLVQVPRRLLEETVLALPSPDKNYYALVSKTVLRDSYLHGLANEHLRDLVSTLLFV